MQNANGSLERLAAGALALALLSTPAAAGSAASPWQQAHEARVRLVAATVVSPSGEERLLAGLHLELSPGWKTYWRTPGDSGGMPPELDWDQSRNIARARLYHPAPHRFADALGTSIGYKQEVVFPIEITPKSAGEPVVLDVGAVLGVCKDICVPVEAELSLTIPTTGPSDPALSALLARFDEAVPREGREGGPELRSLKRGKTADGKLELVALVRFPDGADETDLFVEAPDFAYVPVPVRDGTEEGLARFRIDLSKADKAAAAPGKMLTFTMVSSAGNAEAKARAE